MTGGFRSPSNAVPIRRCVAPAFMASSRSPLMPAEIIVAAGLTARTAAEQAASPANAPAAGTPSGATAITPPRSRPPVVSPVSFVSLASAAMASAKPVTSLGQAPPRPPPARGAPAGAAAAAGPLRVDLEQRGDDPRPLPGRPAERAEQA